MMDEKDKLINESSRSRPNLVKGVEEVWEEEDVRVRPEPEGAAKALQQRPE